MRLQYLRFALRFPIACSVVSALLGHIPVRAQSNLRIRDEFKLSRSRDHHLDQNLYTESPEELNEGEAEPAGEKVDTQKTSTLSSTSFEDIAGTNVIDSTWPIAFGRYSAEIQETEFSRSIFVAAPEPVDVPQISTSTDFDDLHTFNVAFDQLSLGTWANSYGLDVVNVAWFTDDEIPAMRADTRVSPSSPQFASIELKKALILAGMPYPALTSSEIFVPPFRKWSTSTYGRRADGFGYIYGLKFLERQETFSWYATGGILGRSFQDTTVENEIAGVQWGWVATKSVGAVTAKFQSTSFVYYNHGHVWQTGGVGEELVPGAMNRLLFGHPTYFYHGETYRYVAPGGELRAELQLRVTDTISIKTAWSAAVFENVLFPDNRVKYRLPDLGLRDPGPQAGIGSNVFCGIQILR